VQAKLVAAIEAGPGDRDLPALSRELRLVAKELALLDEEQPEMSPLDWIVARRAARHAEWDRRDGGDRRSWDLSTPPHERSTDDRWPLVPD
jgi:hypothetical protein